MPSGRLNALLGVASAVIALLSVSLLNGWLDPGRSGRADLRSELEDRVFDQTDRLGNLQVRSDDNREILYRAVESLTTILNDGRSQGTVTRAIEQWPVVETQVADAQRAKTDLPKITEEILRLATDAGANVHRLQELERQRERVRRWELFEGAMKVMIEAHQTYSTLNARLIEGFAIYEQLNDRTREWVTKHAAGDFKTPTVAAEWYSHASEPLVSGMRRFRDDLARLEIDVADAATRAKAAFDLVEKEVEAGND